MQIEEETLRERMVFVAATMQVELFIHACPADRLETADQRDARMNKLAKLRAKKLS